MSTLSKEYRRQLENTVLKARGEAERGAFDALNVLGLTETKIPPHLNDDEQKFRRLLRAHGKQAGDTQISDKEWDISHLIHECAYEHWHRMLFARFLAENGFLIEPESGLDVDLDFCEERARETKSDKWEVAAGFAQRMLPGIFRTDDPVLRLRLPAESRNGLTVLLASLPRDVFLADDSLGWVYQFWQEKKKDEVNASGEKIGADELAPVTQLFTEDYMVEFLLHNTLGAWWAGRLATVNGNRFAVATCPTEEAARKVCALPGVDWKYLRFVQKDGKWTPAAGTFEGWPKTVKELRVLDPCMGSGHFLVFALVILVRMRMEEEGLSARDACVAVLRDNLFGLELDPRCTQIGAFNLALAAWKLGGHQAELPLNLACSGLAPNTREADWLALAGDDGYLKNGMARLFQLFNNAPVLGSLINPRVAQDELLEAAFHKLQPLLEKALAQETRDDTAHEMAVTARGLAKAAEILAGQFTLVATNVPYLSSGKHNDLLKEFIVTRFNSGKQNLATAFGLRLLDFCDKGGTVGMVTLQDWLSLGSYKKLRIDLLKAHTWNWIAKLGTKSFSTPMWDFNVMLVAISQERPNNAHCLSGLDVSEARIAADKSGALGISESVSLPQIDQLQNPDSRIILSKLVRGTLLEKHADVILGAHVGDFDRFREMFWEIPALNSSWRTWATAPDRILPYCGRHYVMYWPDNGKIHEENPAARVQGHRAWGKAGIQVRLIGNLATTLYSGDLFGSNSAVLLPASIEDLPAIWAFCSSPDFHDQVRVIDQKLDVTCGTFVKVPFDLAHWQKVAAEKYPNGLPKPFSSDPTQWLFNGHPKGADHPLQVAVARLVGYRWPRQTGSSFPDCPALGPDGLEKHADNDGVVCFSQARDEAPAATRLRALLADAYGSEWSHALERKFIAATGSKAESLEEWLVNDFLAQHCDLFHNRPFVWHLWDGRKDGFNVLVNYHKLAGPKGEGHRTLETLTYAYLGDWIARQKDAVAHGEAGADDRLAAALELQGELKKIVAGEPPYDLFIRWKPLPLQPIGWEADVNDGVRLNIRPFMVATLSRGKKGCGLFRAKPGNSVKWEKDRGKEPLRSETDFPWFWKWDEQTVDFAGNGEFDGNRWNDCHYTTAFKRAAREGKK